MFDYFVNASSNSWNDLHAFSSSFLASLSLSGLRLSSASLSSAIFTVNWIPEVTNTAALPKVACKEDPNVKKDAVVATAVATALDTTVFYNAEICPLSLSMLASASLYVTSS